MVTMSTAAFRRSTMRLPDLVLRLAQPHHDAGLGQHVRVELLGVPEEGDAPPVAATGAGRRVQPLHRLQVVGVDVRACARDTVAMASSSPLKSGVSTSMVQPGRASRVSRIVSAKMPAPPSSSSSRLTLVMTTWSSSSSAHASATRRGSSRPAPWACRGRSRSTCTPACRRPPGSGTWRSPPPSTRRCSGSRPPRTPSGGSAAASAS